MITCSNPRYSWVTYFILSNICTLLSTHPLLALSIFVTLPIFRRLIKRLSSFRPLLSIHFFTLSSHPITAPAVNTTQHFLLSYRAHALCTNIPFLLTRRLWTSCHFKPYVVVSQALLAIVHCSTPLQVPNFKPCRRFLFAFCWSCARGKPEHLGHQDSAN